MGGGRRPEGVGEEHQVRQDASEDCEPNCLDVVESNRNDTLLSI